MSEIGKVGEGSIPLPMNDVEGVQETQSAGVQEKSIEQKADSLNNELPLRATVREASVLKAEVAIGGSLQQAKVNSGLDAKVESRGAEKPTVIRGSSGDDNVHISKAPGLLGQLGLYEVNINGQKQYMTKEQLEHTEFHLGAGNDTLVVDANVTAGIKADGGSGNDVLIGGAGNDDLSGGSGNDVIAGRGGNDHISGGRGRDYIFGGDGDDTIDGGSGDDYISGGRGHDTIDGGKGKDEIHGDLRKDNIKLDLEDFLPKKK